MKMTRIAVMTAGLVLASGVSLMAMGNKNNETDKTTGMSSRGADSTYSSGVSTGKMMRSGTTNMNTSGSSDFGAGSGSSTFGTGVKPSTGAGAGAGAGAGTGGSTY